MAKLPEFTQKTPFESPAFTEGRGITPELGRMPSPHEIGGMNDADLSELLRRHGVRQPWNELIAQTTRYNERFMFLPPGLSGTPEGLLLLEEQMYNMYRPETIDGLRKLARRTQERYTTMLAMDGDINAPLVRISELDDGTCAGCERLASLEGPYSVHQAEGLPGDQECNGNCRCQLVAIG